MLVRFNRRTIVEGTIYSPESGDVEINNDIAEQIVRQGYGEIVGFGGRNEIPWRGLTRRSRIAVVGDSITANGFGAGGAGWVGTITSNGTTMTMDVGNAELAKMQVGNYVQIYKDGQPVDTPLLGAIRKVLSSSSASITMSAVCGNEVFPAGASASWRGANLQPCNPGWFSWFNLLLGNPFVITGNYAIGGYGTDLLPYLTNRIDHGPDFDYLAINIGHNDFAAGLTATATFANLIAFIEYYQAKGKRIIVVTPPAWSSTGAGWSTANAIQNAKYASLIREYCRTHHDVGLVDLHRATVDGTNVNGNFRSGYSVDGVHPYANGLLPALRDYGNLGELKSQMLIRPYPIPMVSALDTSSNAGADNLLTNGAMAGSAGSLPTSWTQLTAPSGGTITYDAGTARADGFGYDLKVTTASATGAAAFYNAFHTALSSQIGNWFEWGFQFDVDTDPTNVATLGSRLFLNGGGWGGGTVYHMRNGSGVVAATAIPFLDFDDPLDFISQPFYIRGDIAAPTSALMVIDYGFSAASSGVVRFGQAFLRQCANPFA
jgi:hypothetical protein